MKAKALNALLALAVVALAVVAFSQSRTIRDLRAQLANQMAMAASDEGQGGDVRASALPAATPAAAVTPVAAPATEEEEEERCTFARMAEWEGEAAEADEREQEDDEAVDAGGAGTRVEAALDDSSGIMVHMKTGGLPVIGRDFHEPDRLVGEGFQLPDLHVLPRQFT